MEELDELLLKHYLINCTDVRFCPNAKCEYAGYVQIDEDTRRIECREALSCEMCDTQWRDPLLREPANWLTHLKETLLFGEDSSLDSI